jgi:hypothetical protein
MSDLDGLPGIFPNNWRFNAENGGFAFSKYEPQTGERGLQPIELGSREAMLVLDLRTREHGVGRVKVGSFEKWMAPVGSPLPPYPDEPDVKPMLGYWGYSPTFGEGRIETCATLFRNALADIVARCLKEPQAVEGLQPIIQFVDCVPVPIRALNKTFFAPRIERVSWTERDKVPGWANRPPTVPLPVALPLLAASAPKQIQTTAAPAKEPAAASRRHKSRRLATKSPDDLPPFNDDLPENLK